ncbi:uncharacterized protein LOC134186476 isoform X2 [Corticium candelabrum]|uniref:uncharacterized protein LOC134186476 isoform X2 n=1 Tax=Corticium candelabrum TaxID=121492 RepID=UPI002E254B19|nr:uncharacterized protein LOC134186476 isoform X2 [Corticium candelabrum]
MVPWTFVSRNQKLAFQYSMHRISANGIFTVSTKLFHMRPVLFADFKPRRPELLLKWCTLRKYVDTASLFSDAILATQSVKACLTNIPLFRLWSSEAINCLAKLCKPMLFSEGSIVLEEGVEACLEMCVLLSGRIVFTAEGQVLVSVSAGLKGYWFGEEGLFLSEQRRCSVKADVLSQIVVIDRSQISYVLKQFPSEKRHYDKFMKHWESNRQRLDYSLLYKHKGLLDLEIIMERLRKTKELKDCSHIAAYQIAMEMSLRLGNGSSVLSHTDIGGNAFLVVLGTVELVKDNRVEESLVAGGYYDHRRSGKVLDARLTAVTVLALFPFSAVAEAFNE